MIGEIGTAGGTGYVIEYAGSAIRALSMEGRMTLCNLTIEGGARAGLVAPGRDHLRLPEGPARRAQGRRLGDGAAPTGRRFFTDDDALFDREVIASTPPTIAPTGHLGHQPRGRAAPITGSVPDPGELRRPATSAPRPSGRWTTWA